jgi:hypothetical protein
MNTVVIGSPSLRDVAELRVALERAFNGLRDALVAGSSVTFTVWDGDLLGHDSLYDAVYANAVVGMARAATFEGAVKDGWQVNVLAAPGAEANRVGERSDAIVNLGLQGQVAVFGSQLVGKVIP